MAAVSASATRCTPGKSSSPMERPRCALDSSASSPTIPELALRDTPTRGTRRLARRHGSTAGSSRCSTGDIAMLSARFKPWHVPLFLAKYAWLTARRMPVLVHFEVTLRCNARCGFSDYWKTDPSARATELTSFADAARFFNPMLVTFTGGEPLLRR